MIELLLYITVDSTFMLFCRNLSTYLIYALFKESYRSNLVPVGKLYIFFTLGVCVWVLVCVRVWVCVCARACFCVCVFGCV